MVTLEFIDSSFDALADDLTAYHVLIAFAIFPYFTAPEGSAAKLCLAGNHLFLTLDIDMFHWNFVHDL